MLPSNTYNNEIKMTTARAPRKKEIEECETLTKELASKGRALLRKQGEEVPHARKATKEDNQAACRAYLDHCYEVMDIASQKNKATKTAKEIPPVNPLASAMLNPKIKR